MVYEINAKNLELGCSEILKIRLNRLEEALVNGEEVTNVLDAASSYREARKLLAPHLKDYSELDNKYQDIIGKFSKLCEELDP